MRVLIASEVRFHRASDGGVYTTGPDIYDFWASYLEVFDEVTLLARVRSQAPAPGGRRADGPGVVLSPLDYYQGPWRYLAKRPALARQAKAAVAGHTGSPTALILRAPGAVSYLAWSEIRRRRLPYGVQVLGDPWESLREAPGLWRAAAPLARRWSRRHLEHICREAPLAHYVTSSYLQRRYPCQGARFACPEVRLTATASPAQMSARLARLAQAAGGERPWEIGFIGSLERLYKAPEVHLAALARCAAQGWNFRFSLVGEGRCRPALEALAQRLGIAGHVRFLGFVPPGRPVESFLDGLDLFLLASRTEGLPRALIEAMARGCPAIGSTAGGIPEVLEPEAVVEAGSVEALSSRVTELLSHPDRLRRMAERHLAFAGRFLPDRLRPLRREFLCRLRDLYT